MRGNVVPMFNPFQQHPWLNPQWQRPNGYWQRPHFGPAIMNGPGLGPMIRPGLRPMVPRPREPMIAWRPMVIYGKRNHVNQPMLKPMPKL